MGWSARYKNPSLPNVNVRSTSGNIFGWKISCRLQGTSSNLKTHPLFSRENLDLTMDLPQGSVDKLAHTFHPTDSETRRKCLSLSPVRISVTSWTVAHQAPLSMRFSGQEYWSGLPFPPPGYLPNPGTEPWVSHTAGRRFTESPGKKERPKQQKHPCPITCNNPGESLVETTGILVL